MGRGSLRPLDIYTVENTGWSRHAFLTLAKFHVDLPQTNGINLFFRTFSRPIKELSNISQLFQTFKNMYEP